MNVRGLPSRSGGYCFRLFLRTREAGSVPGLMLAVLINWAVSGMLWAQPLPSLATARDAQTGALLYTEQRTVVYEDQVPSYMEVTYRNADGGLLGSKQVDFSVSRQQPEVRMRLPESGGTFSLERADQRWVIRSQAQEGSKARRSWPKLGRHVLIDEALLSYLVEHHQAIAAGDLARISVLSLPHSKVDRYYLRAHGFGSPGGEQVQVDFFKHRLFGPDERRMSFRLERGSGRLLQFVGPSTCFRLESPRCADEVVVDFHY